MLARLERRLASAKALCRTTRADPAHAVAPNVLGRDFVAEATNEKWVGEVTFVPTGEGWLYLATLIDLHNRAVIGWAMGEHNDLGKV